MLYRASELRGRVVCGCKVEFFLSFMVSGFNIL